MAALLKLTATAAVFVVVAALCGAGVSAQTHHVVGDDGGWGPAFNITSWLSGRVFKVGDKIWFKNAGMEESLVELKGLEEFLSCNLTNPIRMYTDKGNHVSLEEEGVRYFTSGNPESCKNGLKLPVAVESDDPYPAWGVPPPAWSTPPPVDPYPAWDTPPPPPPPAKPSPEFGPPPPVDPYPAWDTPPPPPPPAKPSPKFGPPPPVEPFPAFVPPPPPPPSPPPPPKPSPKFGPPPPVEPFPAFVPPPPPPSSPPPPPKPSPKFGPPPPVEPFPAFVPPPPPPPSPPPPHPPSAATYLNKVSFVFFVGLLLCYIGF
ncbi:hypothetical protein BUALT_Bualt03G0083800 [Buddleja alternifolia]|uniref:Phytocyanin domain-containing protein n=1 Tax=Buddleja alternifolia TaxID=168488 RepID=A0AAV6Y2V6_9LAMI|nr:hypothetical protein BUALT_Bualt03G0083800 [Buddleja alternifolia]